MQGLNITAFQYNKVHVALWTQAGHVHHCKQCHGHWTRGVVGIRSQSQAAQRNTYRAKKFWILIKAWRWILCPFPSFFFLLIHQNYAEYFSGREGSLHPLFPHSFAKQHFWQSASLSMVQWEPIGTLGKLKNTTGSTRILEITFFFMPVCEDNIINCKEMKVVRTEINSRDSAGVVFI